MWGSSSALICALNTLNNLNPLSKSQGIRKTRKKWKQNEKSLFCTFSFVPYFIVRYRNPPPPFRFDLVINSVRSLRGLAIGRFWFLFPTFVNITILSNENKILKRVFLLFFSTKVKWVDFPFCWNDSFTQTSAADFIWHISPNKTHTVWLTLIHRLDGHNFNENFFSFLSCVSEWGNNHSVC